MTADGYRYALAQLGFSQVAAARVLGVSSRTSQTYALEGPSGPAASVLLLLLEMGPDQREQAIAMLLLHHET